MAKIPSTSQVVSCTSRCLIHLRILRATVKVKYQSIFDMHDGLSLDDMDEVGHT